jgi:hypothetical protein
LDPNTKQVKTIAAASAVAYGSNKVGCIVP